jgi:hypothetical protein
MLIDPDLTLAPPNLADRRRQEGGAAMQVEVDARMESSDGCCER